MKRYSTSFAVFEIILSLLFTFAVLVTLIDRIYALVALALSGTLFDTSCVLWMFFIVALGYILISLVSYSIFFYLYTIFDNKKMLGAKEKLADIGAKIAKSRVLLFWSPRVYNVIVNFWISSKDYKKALEEADRFYKLDKKFLPSYYSTVIFIYFVLSEDLQVCKLCNRAIEEVKKKDIGKIANLWLGGYALLEMGRLEAAIEYSSRILELLKGTKWHKNGRITIHTMHLVLALAYYLKKDYDKAWTHIYEVDRSVRKKTPLFFYTKAKVLEKLGKDEEAKKALSLSKQIDKLAEENEDLYRVKKLLDEN